MLGLILDVVVLMVLIRLITGDEEGGWGKPALIALLAAIGMIGANIGAVQVPEYALLILFGALTGVALIVGLCCVALLQIPIGKSALIAGGFVIFKTVFIFFTALAFAF